MTLFEVLSLDNRVIVLSDVGEGLIYTWNRASTLQIWCKKKIPMYYISEHPLDSWEETNVQVLSEEPGNYESARQAAISWSIS